jgi:hypothetical protein
MRQMMRGAHGPFGRAVAGYGSQLRKRSSCHLARMSRDAGNTYMCTLTWLMTRARNQRPQHYWVGITQ